MLDLRNAFYPGKEQLNYSVFESQRRYGFDLFIVEISVT